MATTGSERGLSLRSPGRFLAVAGRLIELYRRQQVAARVTDPTLRDAVAEGWMAAQAYKLATDMTVTRLSEGAGMGAESSLNKVFWSEMDIHLHETALRLLGEDGDVDGAWMKGYQFALAGPIYAGTNEIQRNVIAERLLGLPRK
jgi:alkylation response protein AidB-like acyl-CoA dehydrogenase